MVGEKLSSACTLFLHQGEAGSVPAPHWEVVWGEETVPYLGLALEWGGMELGGCEVGSSAGREEPLEGRDFERLGARFVPSCFCKNG